MRRIDVPAHLARIGNLVRAGWQSLGEKHGLPVKVGGRPEMALLAFEHPESAALLTLMTARMLNRGFLAAGGFNPMLAHEDHHVSLYLAALDEVFGEMAEAIAENDIVVRIGGPVKHTGFARLT
jgi:glutamate-1-semialdehyde 2,1-aminomutase